MSKYQREKGKRGERDWAGLVEEALRESGLHRYADNVGRGWQAKVGSDAPDVIAPFVWFECKSGASPRLLAALDQAKQAQQDSDQRRWGECVPVAACRFDGHGKSRPARWVVVMDGEAFLDLWADWLARGEA